MAAQCYRITIIHLCLAQDEYDGAPALHTIAQEQDNGVFDGQSYRVAWNKYVAQTGTQFALAGFRYSSVDYRTFNDHSQRITKMKLQPR